VSNRVKTANALGVGISEVCRRFPRPVLLTLTFQENVTEISQARRCFTRLKQRMVYRARVLGLRDGLMGCGVWQTQSRGAWHIHVVINHPIPIDWLRPAALACGFGPFVDLQRIGNHKGFRDGQSPRDVARYLARYIGRDLEGQHTKGVRLVEYFGGARAASVRFTWARGLGRLYRVGRGIWSEVWSGWDNRPTKDDFWFIVRLGWAEICQAERDLLLETSSAVRHWWTGSADRPNCPF